MAFKEVAPGVIYFDRELSLEEEDSKQYNPEHFMVFDGVEFITLSQFIFYLQHQIIEKEILHHKTVFSNIIQSTKEDTGGVFISLTFQNIKVNLKIPGKSDILNIERERIYVSLFVNNSLWYLDLSIENFGQFKQLLKGFI